MKNSFPIVALFSLDSPFIDEFSANSLFSPFSMAFRQDCQKLKIFAENRDCSSFRILFQLFRTKFCPGEGGNFQF